MNKQNQSVNGTQSENRAKQLLTGYFRLMAEKRGIHWDSDNDAEVCEIVDAILEAADERAKLIAIGITN